jgi:dTDP-4-dehydrorhamnose reductase
VRVYVTGGSGFVGAHVVRVMAAHGAEVAAPGHSEVDVTDPRAVRDSVVTFAPDAIVHCAILNDFGRLYADRQAGWDAYVGATRSLVDAANEADARMLLVSTDWVFDGTQSGATEDTPPNPINLYGFLKAASELVVTERADRGSVARIAAVQGSPNGGASSAVPAHGGASPAGAADGGTPSAVAADGGSRAQGAAPREQDAGFGYFVAALVQRLRNGERFGVWESERINMVATPTLASEAAELMWRILERDLDGIFHCCGGESVDRRTLARRAAEIFELDAGLLDLGVEPPHEALSVPAAAATGSASAGPAATGSASPAAAATDSASPGPAAAGSVPIAIPYDTSLDASRTAAALEVELPDVAEMLRRMCRELTPA